MFSEEEINLVDRYASMTGTHAQLVNTCPLKIITTLSEINEAHYGTQMRAQGK